MTVCEKYGSTIMIDGWIDGRRMTILKFQAHSQREVYFFKSIDESDITKDC